MAEIHIEPWGPDDFELVEKLMGDPEMTRFLGQLYNREVGQDEVVTLIRFSEIRP